MGPQPHPAVRADVVGVGPCLSFRHSAPARRSMVRMPATRASIAKATLVRPDSDGAALAAAAKANASTSTNAAADFKTALAGKSAPARLAPTARRRFSPLIRRGQHP